MWELYQKLESIARQFKEVVVETKIYKLSSGEPAKLRIELIDGSFCRCLGFNFGEIFLSLGQT